MKDEAKNIIPYVYLHINNGGVTFKITDNNGPQLIVSAHHFDNQTNEMILNIPKNALVELSKMFYDASMYEFSTGRKYDTITGDNVLVE